MLLLNPVTADTNVKPTNIAPTYNQYLIRNYFWKILNTKHPSLDLMTTDLSEWVGLSIKVWTKLLKLPIKIWVFCESKLSVMDVNHYMIQLWLYFEDMGGRRSLNQGKSNSRTSIEEVVSLPSCYAFQWLSFTTF